MVCPVSRTASFTGVRLTNVPLVDPKSRITVLPCSTMIWQCELETEGFSILKSLANPRPTKLMPGLSCTSSAPGDPGLIVNRGICLLRLLSHTFLAKPEQNVDKICGSPSVPFSPYAAFEQL